MTTLITGGAGFIGSQLACALLARGEKLVLLDNFNDYYDPALKRANVAQFKDDADVTVIEGDIRDTALVERVISDYGVRKIANLAAMAGVRNSVRDAGIYFDVNLTGCLHLVEAASKAGIEQFVLASTSSVYGKTAQIPFVEEDAADRPLAPYPASKRAAEIMAYTFHHLFGLNVTCLRFFNVYGPHGRPDMMPIKVIKAIQEDQPITLFEAGKINPHWAHIYDNISGGVAAIGGPPFFRNIKLGCWGPTSNTEIFCYFFFLNCKNTGP